MTPKQQAMSLYAQRPNPWEYVMDRHLIRMLPQGHLIDTPECCLWGFPIRLTPRVLKHGTVTIHHEPNPNCWMVWLCTGDLAHVLSLIPYPLPHIAFARDNRLRGYSFEKLTRKLMKTSSPTWHTQPEQQHQFKGGKQPEQTKTQKENEKLNNQLLKQQLAAMGKEAPAMPTFVAPPPPKYAPPPSQTSQDAEAAAQEFRRATKMRRGFAKSKLGAGDTGRSSPTSAAPAPAATAQGSKPTLG
jgi:hypothetical protein